MVMPSNPIFRVFIMSDPVFDWNGFPMSGYLRTALTACNHGQSWSPGQSVSGPQGSRSRGGRLVPREEGMDSPRGSPAFGMKAWTPARGGALPRPTGGRPECSGTRRGRRRRAGASREDGTGMRSGPILKRDYSGVSLRREPSPPLRRYQMLPSGATFRARTPPV